MTTMACSWPCLPRKHPLAKDAAPVGTYLEDLPYMDLSAIKELPLCAHLQGIDHAKPHQPDPRGS